MLDFAFSESEYDLGEVEITTVKNKNSNIQTYTYMTYNGQTYDITDGLDYEKIFGEVEVKIENDSEKVQNSEKKETVDSQSVTIGKGVESGEEVTLNKVTFYDSTDCVVDLIDQIKINKISAAGVIGRLTNLLVQELPNEDEAKLNAIGDAIWTLAKEAIGHYTEAGSALTFVDIIKSLIDSEEAFSEEEKKVLKSNKVLVQIEEYAWNYQRCRNKADEMEKRIKALHLAGRIKVSEYDNGCFDINFEVDGITPGSGYNSEVQILKEINEKAGLSYEEGTKLLRNENNILWGNNDQIIEEFGDDKGKAILEYFRECNSSY